MHNEPNSAPADRAWQEVATVEKLDAGRPLVIRPNRRQIVIFRQSGRIVACDNRCPHEGYPLSQGSLDERCILTCNWHNWKFDLRTGENLFGGDSLRIYETAVRNGRIWINLQDPPVSERIARTMDNLKEAFADDSYDRISRELARMHFLGADSRDVLRNVVLWSYEQLEFGFTHAFAGMADWLDMHDEHAGNDEVQLACLQETVSHAAFDVLRQPRFPYCSERRPYDETAFLEAVEQENETEAVSLILGGLESGLHFTDFESVLTRSALAHYNDFGHSLIYVTKAARLTEKLGTAVERPLLLALVRSLVYATREDRIPEFRGYRNALQRWKNGGTSVPKPELWREKGIQAALDATLSCSQRPPVEIFRSMLLACALSMLGYDPDNQSRVHVPVSDNVNALDFSHALTFANAVRSQCSKFPGLWPSGLLQMACFLGRNAAHTSPDPDYSAWDAEDIGSGLELLRDKVVDHGQNEPIVSVHLLKTFCAVREEIRHLPGPARHLPFAALHRFLCLPMKRRHSLRTAYQSIRFVRNET